MANIESSVTIAGCRTRLMRAGAGPPLLCLHGAGGAPAWLPFMEALSRDFDVIVPEHPGYGGSQMPDWLDRVGDLAFFYLDFIDHFGLEAVNLVGISMGGWIAAELAMRDDAALATLVLCCPAGHYVHGLARTDIFMLSPEDTVRHLVNDPELAEKMLAQPMDEEAQMAVLKNRLTTAKLGWQPRMHDPDLPKWLHRVSTPTLILWGAGDRIFSADYGPAWRDMIPGAELKVFPDCGHACHVERTDDTVAAVRDFIGKARP